MDQKYNFEDISWAHGRNFKKYFTQSGPSPPSEGDVQIRHIPSHIYRLHSRCRFNISIQIHLRIFQDLKSAVCDIVLLKVLKKYSRFSFDSSKHDCKPISVQQHAPRSWWRHQMKTFSGYWPFVRGIHRSPVNSPHKGQWRGALMFYLICASINCWVNNREAGDLRRHHAHFDIIVM